MLPLGTFKNIDSAEVFWVPARIWFVCNGPEIKSLLIPAYPQTVSRPILHLFPSLARISR